MAFGWADFFEVARGLADGEVKGGQEAVLRTAIGRAYYASFNLAVAYCKRKQKQFHAGGKDHELVRIWLQQLGYTDLAHAMYELHRWRKEADYDNPAQWNSTLMWLAAKDRAQEVITVLK